MKDGLALNLIYHYGHEADSEFPELSGRYKVLYFFTEAGPVPVDVQNDVSIKIFNKTVGHPATFSSLDDLKDFAMSVCRHLNSPEVFVLSVQDYNVGVEASKDVRSFREIYRRYGLNLANPDIISRGPGLFGKFFNNNRKS
ncbi:MAG: hypothetical protein K2P81_08125 [Bacteriovoracaceae bacterium]|nr:hypothetical protein [Bacteriovoracaceae bacterium]